MVSHNKASDYTCGTKNRLNAAQAAQSHRQAGYSNPTQFNNSISSAPQSLPPRAFQLPQQSQSSYGNINGRPLPQTSTGIGAYGMAAVGLGQSQHQQSDPSSLYNQQTPGGSAAPSFTTGGGGEEGGFDMFSFLMDDEAGLGNNWDSLEVPSDFSLWT
jgi:hypothetical protein